MKSGVQTPKTVEWEEANAPASCLRQAGGATPEMRFLMQPIVSFDSGKVCVRCGTHRLLSRFPFSPRTYKHGRVCLPCSAAAKEATRVRAKAARDALSERQREEKRQQVQARRVAELAKSRESNRESQKRHRQRRGSRDRLIEDRLHRFGLTYDEYRGMLAAQDGKCAVCGESETEPYSLTIDHDHETGVVRGLLCRQCNTGLGMFRDDARLLEGAILYLRQAAGAV